MAYFIVGPENTKGRPVSSIIEDSIESGFTFIQIRSKEASASELIRFTVEAAVEHIWNKILNKYHEINNTMYYPFIVSVSHGVADYRKDKR